MFGMKLKVTPTDNPNVIVVHATRAFWVKYLLISLASLVVPIVIAEAADAADRRRFTNTEDHLPEN